MSKKILIIDDDQTFCDNLRDILSGEGFDVVQVRNQECPVSAFTNSRPDAVVLRSEMFKGDLEGLLGKLTRDEPPKPLAEIPPEPKVTTEKLKEFQNMFHAVKAKYSHSLPAKVEELGRDIKAAAEDGENSQALEVVRQTAHKLVGTAGSYGYHTFADSMRAIEEIAIEMATKKEHPDREAQWKRAREIWAAAMAEAESIASEIKAEAPGGTAAAQTRGPVFARVVLVDEDEAFLDMVEEMGRQINVVVLKASSDSSAMNMALMHTLDAAIINVHPQTQESSFQLAISLRSLPGYETLPLAFISSDSKLRTDVEAAHVGASLHLDKPLDANSLEAAVRYLVAIRQGGRPKVMVVDDDPDFSEKIALDLRNDNLLVRTVNDPLKLVEALSEFPPDVLLLDVMMPGMNGFQVCQMVRQMPRWRDLPIIFITAEIHIEARVKAFTSGGDDYLPKPVVTEELLARVRVRLEKSRLLKERSDKDVITGLLLRRAFVEQINNMMADAERTGTILSLCLMDVDHFKKVNDTYGHMAGDRVLAGFGQLLSRRFRVDDLRGRWGGEEFILAFRRENKETMCKAINRVQEEFSSITFESDDQRKFNVSFSGGIASYPDDGSTLYELLTAADARLYAAKSAGRRRVFTTENE